MPSAASCRREGEKLFLQGEKCFTDKCAIERRSYALGTARSKKRRPHVRFRQAAAGEAEAASHIGPARAPVPQDLCRGFAQQRRDGASVFMQLLESRLDTVRTAWVRCEPHRGAAKSCAITASS